MTGISSSIETLLPFSHERLPLAFNNHAVFKNKSTVSSMDEANISQSWERFVDSYRKWNYTNFRVNVAYLFMSDACLSWRTHYRRSMQIYRWQHTAFANVQCRRDIIRSWENDRNRTANSPHVGTRCPVSIMANSKDDTSPRETTLAPWQCGVISQVHGVSSEINGDRGGPNTGPKNFDWNLWNNQSVRIMMAINDIHVGNATVLSPIKIHGRHLAV